MTNRDTENTQACEPEAVHLALNFRGVACGTSDDFIDMTQDRAAITCPDCVARMVSA